MNEWPTRARTGVPPSSRTSSGTALEQIRLWTTVRSSGGASVRKPFEDRARDERCRQRPAHRLRAIVDEEHSIGVAVEREPDVGALVDDRGLQVTEVLRLDGVGRMVGEGAVELAEEDRRAEWQAFEDRGHDESTDAVRRVRDDAKWRERTHVDERMDVRDELGEQVTLLDATRRVGLRRADPPRQWP